MAGTSLAATAVRPTKPTAVQGTRSHGTRSATRFQDRRALAGFAVRPAAAPPPRSSAGPLCAVSTDENKKVDGAGDDFCDDVVCTSSPAVEQTVRSLSNDIEMMRWSKRLFQPEVKYQDSFRSFQGRERYERCRFVKDNVEEPSVFITGMKMEDKSHSVITWRLTGKLAGQAIDVAFTEKFEHNQLTGRVVDHKESWSCSQGGIVFAATRTAWSAAQAQEDMGELISQSLDFGDGGGEDDLESYRDPSDPTKFFNNKEDDGTQDMIQYALAVALLYLVFQAYSALNHM